MAIETPIAAPLKPHWSGLAFLTLAVLTSVVDSSVMTVATPTIARVFHAGLPLVEWTTTIYSLFFGATMLLWSKLGSIHGQRRLFVIGGVFFAAGSALVGLSPSIGVMIAMRAVQGIGAAMFNPAAIALIALMFQPSDRPLAYGINGMAGSIGVALGYVLGGACAQYLDWRWAFYVNLPICVVAIAGALRFVPRDQPQPKRAALDLVGALQSLVGLVLLIFGLSEGETFGWWRPRAPVAVFHRAIGLPISLVPICLVGGGVILIIYVRRELLLVGERREPVFDITLFRLRSFCWGGLGTMLRYLAQFTVNYGVTLYLQVDEGIPALKAALVSLPNALAGLVAGPVGGWLANRIGVARSVQLGLICQAAGIIWVAAVLAPHLSVLALIAPFGLFGFGAGLAGAQLNTATLQDVPIGRTGDAAGAATTLRQLGASFAVAVFALIASTSTARLAMEGYDTQRQSLESMRITVLAMLGVNVICLLMALRIPNHRPRFDPKPG
jgi:EmrB/QacA subfamily drug resistance transporter